MSVFRGRWLAILGVALLLIPLLGAGWLLTQGYSRSPQQWWYPFIPSIFTDHYTAGPFAMTSNTREDNPVWESLPALNRAQARMSYSMTRGAPRADIAWLLGESEWKDKPSLPFGKHDPNADESAISRALIAQGLVYERISRRNLAGAEAVGKTLTIGAMGYRALLINDLEKADPRLLEHVYELSEAGIPVFWLGEWPQRATGWADYTRRDQQVSQHVVKLQSRLTVLDEPDDLSAAIAGAGIQALVAPGNREVMPFRMSQRSLGSSFLALLFNEAGEAVSADLEIKGSYSRVILLDPESGEKSLLGEEGSSTTGKTVAVSVPAGRSRILLLEGEDLSQAADREWDFDAWITPPRSLYPHIRWWWPGNAVQEDQLRRELDSMYEAGFGGVELQTLTLGFTANALSKYRNAIYQVGTAEYLRNVRAVFEHADALGMSVDMTLGSGWSSGGPFITEHPERQLLQSFVDISGPMALSMDLPKATEPGYVGATNWVIPNTIGRFDDDLQIEAVVAARIDTDSEPFTLSEFKAVADAVVDGKLHWQVPEGDFRIFVLYRNNTNHNAVAAAYPGAQQSAPILDHLDPGGVTEYIEKLGEPWLQGIAPHKPENWFVDSFELIGELPWSEIFAATFQDMHGYDIKPYLPLVFMEQGESKYVNVVSPPHLAYRGDDQMAVRIREDYELTREHLFTDAFVLPLKQWAQARGIGLKLQAHGGYGDYLDAYQLADVPESEGLFAAGSFEFLKLASSAGHISGASIISSESFITMTFDFDGLDIDDYYFLAGHAFSAGINRTVCHGYAHHFPLQNVAD